MDEVCGVPMRDEIPCGKILWPHCPEGTGPQCTWQKCTRGHVIRPDGHVMGDETP